MVSIIRNVKNIKIQAKVWIIQSPISAMIRESQSMQIKNTDSFYYNISVRSKSGKY